MADEQNAHLARFVQAALAGDDSMDAPGVVWFEHINLLVGDREIAEAFYFDVLGCTEDPSSSFHANLGQQQFHLGVPTEADQTPHTIAGSIGISVPSLDVVRERVDRMRKNSTPSESESSTPPLPPSHTQAFPGTQFQMQDHETSLTITCPWGNIFRIFPVAPTTSSDTGVGPGEEAAAVPKMAKAHSHWDHGMAVRGKPGIRFVEWRVKDAKVYVELCH